MFTWLVELISGWIAWGNYPIIFLFMILESMVFPVPSEAVMPFAGFLIAQGKLSWILVIVVSTLGSLVGSLISYYIGFYGGRPFVNKYGKYFLLNKRHLEWTEKWFNNGRGGLTIFISRFIPVVRHLISIPAGMGKMNKKKFLFFTLIGAALWNTFLTVVGFLLNKNWMALQNYSKQIDIAILVIIVLLVIWWIYRRMKH